MAKKVLVAPLDWGLGHATRCVPVIRALIDNGHNVVLGVTPLTRKILDEEFPALQRVDLPVSEISYSKVLPVWASILMDYKRLKKVVEEETLLAEKIVKVHNIDVIISDNRYGFYCKGIKNIFLTHQLWIKTPVMSKSANSINHTYIKNFSEVWIPDFQNEENNLAGELSHGDKDEFNIKYIGILSRLEPVTPDSDKPYMYTFLISGPEPKRTLFEEEVVNYLNVFKGKFALVRGTTVPSNFIMRNLNCDVFDMPSKMQLEKILANSKMVVCRSGYSTLMDLIALKRPAFLYPTYGQTEQSYLASYLNNKYGMKKIRKVEDISITPHRGIESEYAFPSSPGLLNAAIQSL
jgi:UDP:flavonoid glycosyltransferase YjiC (YdhE family)